MTSLTQRTQRTHPSYKLVDTGTRSQTNISHTHTAHTHSQHKTSHSSPCKHFLVLGSLERKKNCTNSHKKRKGGGSANAPHCARSASDPRARPFFPLSATMALRTTALVLVSQGFGCPTVVQDLSKRVQ